MSYLASIFAAVFGLQLHLNEHDAVEFVPDTKSVPIFRKDAVLIVDTDDYDMVTMFLENGLSERTTNGLYSFRGERVPVIDEQTVTEFHDMLIIGISYVRAEAFMDALEYQTMLEASVCRGNLETHVIEYVWDENTTVHMAVIRMKSRRSHYTQ